MIEKFLDHDSQKSYSDLKVSLPVKTVIKNGKTYELLGQGTKNYSWCQRIVKGIRGTISTLFSLGLKLFSSQTQSNWKIFFKGKKDFVVYKQIVSLEKKEPIADPRMEKEEDAKSKHSVSSASPVDHSSSRPSIVSPFDDRVLDTPPSSPRNLHNEVDAAQRFADDETRLDKIRAIFYKDSPRTQKDFYTALNLAREITENSLQQAKAFHHCLNIKTTLGSKVDFIDFSQGTPSKVLQFEWDCQLSLLDTCRFLIARYINMKDYGKAKEYLKVAFDMQVKLSNIIPLLKENGLSETPVLWEIQGTGFPHHTVNYTFDTLAQVFHGQEQFVLTNEE